MNKNMSNPLNMEILIKKILTTKFALKMIRIIIIKKNYEILFQQIIKKIITINQVR